MSAAFRDRAAKFNSPGQRHNNVFVRPGVDGVPLRYPDFSQTGFVLERSQLRYEPGQGEDGRLRLDLHETLPTPDGDLVFHRGGVGFIDAGNVKYGHVAVHDLADPLPRPVPSGGGRGTASRAAKGPLYAPGYLIRVRQIPNAMLYKRPSDPPAGKTKVGAKWMHYADPASGQGDRHDIHYSVMTWSWLNVRGGGMDRALTARARLSIAATSTPSPTPPGTSSATAMAKSSASTSRRDRPAIGCTDGRFTRTASSATAWAARPSITSSGAPSRSVSPRTAWISVASASVSRMQAREEETFFAGARFVGAIVHHGRPFRSFRRGLPEHVACKRCD